MEFFIFILGTDVREKILGGSELSLATARELATKARLEVGLDNPSPPDRGARTLRPVVELEEPAPSPQPPLVAPNGPSGEIQLTCDACSTGNFTSRYDIATASGQPRSMNCGP